jgi:DNA-binding CsgD family transcriptional regulator
MLLLEEKVDLVSPEPLQKLGLTPREAEVLFWLTQGKSSPEIAIILGAAANTVKKHVQNIFQKLGVENRTAAAMRALEVLGMP